MKHFLLPDGRKFSWHACGSGAPLILLHGWGSSAAIFSDLMSQLSNHQCLAPDLPGYGASERSQQVDLSELGDDLITWLDALGLESVNLLGWSLGGMVAQKLATRFPARIARLILVATTPCFVSTLGWRYGLADTAVRSLARDFNRNPTQTRENFWRLQFQGEESIPTPQLPPVERETALDGLELLRRVDLRDELNKITMPTLVLHGSADSIIPVTAGRYLANTLSTACLHEIHGCGHVPFLSAPESVGAAIRKFLA